MLVKVINLIKILLNLLGKVLDPVRLIIKEVIMINMLLVKRLFRFQV